MLPQITDSGRFVNVYSIIHMLIYSHGHLLETLPVAPDPAVFTGVCSLWPLLFPHSHHEKRAWASSFHKLLWASAASEAGKGF